MYAAARWMPTAPGGARKPAARPGAGAAGRGRHCRPTAATGQRRPAWRSACSRARYSTPRIHLDAPARRPGGPGLPLERALTALADEADDERQRHLVARCAPRSTPAAPSPALAQHPREFSDIYCAVIGAGEVQRGLGQVL